MTDTIIVARSDIVAPQIDIEDDEVRADVADDVVTSIDPPSAVSSDFFNYLPQPEITSCIGK